MNGYGTDLKALDDLPDPDELVSDELNVAYAQARRLLEPDDAHEEIGDFEPCDAVDLREQFGGAFDPSDLEDLNAVVAQVLERDERVRSTESSVTLAGGVLEVASESQGTAGPFGFVLGIDAVGLATLRTT